MLTYFSTFLPGIISRAVKVKIPHCKQHLILLCIIELFFGVVISWYNFFFQNLFIFMFSFTLRPFFAILQKTCKYHLFTHFLPLIYINSKKRLHYTSAQHHCDDKKRTFLCFLGFYCLVIVLEKLEKVIHFLLFFCKKVVTLRK